MPLTSSATNMYPRFDANTIVPFRIAVMTALAPQRVQPTEAEWCDEDKICGRPARREDFERKRVREFARLKVLKKHPHLVELEVQLTEKLFE
jgi:hypothetical protein